MFLSLGLLISIFLACADGSDSSILVVLDDLGMQQSYSIFFNQLKSRGYSLSFFAAEDPYLSLISSGEYLYHHIILFAPNAQEYGMIDIASLLDFIDEGHNVLIATDSIVSDTIRDIASECGIEFDEEGTRVMDHFHSSSLEDHTIISIEPTEKTTLLVPVITGSKAVGERKPILFKGVSQTITENGLNFPILRGYDTTYSFNPIKNNGTKVGKEVVLVSALQARNNARVVFSGSIQLFSDRFFGPTSDNQYFVGEISKWLFKERGLLRASNIKHHRVGETVTPPIYRIKDEITYSVTIEEFIENKWVPFQSKDVQVEFTMLDPYVRTFLIPKTNGVFSATFQIPDVYGVFSFEVDYHQIGYTSLSLKTIQPVRPYRHDEYERFIKMANPYYLSAISMLGGVFVIFVFLLFTK